ncbi:hypothetical protein RD792_000281 [Penstemon davidsonii]|uniref:RING-type domain-containing protein n=1 Tax=Penstemon davidsonii TaxID=160366 RepID=A0ABR0DUQ0_9LAMI|nr:hypothetical protein RD792_000281 [Penstemon davidsonii]
MTRFLAGTNSPPPQTASSSSSPAPPPVQNLDSDFVVILAALLCALICVLGLVAVARCSWIRRLSSAASGLRNPRAPSANKGVKKKVLKSLPSFTYGAGDNNEQTAKLFECPICLAEFAAGEEIRVLPQCGHGFHIGCIDTWLGSHSSCPSCRQILVSARCQKCGSVPEAAPSAASGGGVQPEPRENYVNMFLP